MKIEDLKLEAIVTLRVDGTPSAHEFLVRRLYLNDAGTQENMPPSHQLRVPATPAEMKALLDSAAFAQNAENAGLHAQIAQLQSELAALRDELGAARALAAASEQLQADLAKSRAAMVTTANDLAAAKAELARQDAKRNTP
jgi:hypothetical protein